MDAQQWYQDGLAIEDTLARGQYFRRGEHDPARRPWALLGLATVAQACMRVEGAIDKAIELAEEAAAMLPDISLPRRRKGQYLMLAGRGQEALATLEVIVKDFPNDPEAWCLLGSIQCELELHEPCARSFERVVALRPETGEYWRGLGEAQAMAKNDARAMEAFQQAVALDPSDKDSWHNIMLIQARHQDLNSRHAAEHVISADPNDEASLAICAAASKEAGDIPAAVATYERLVARFPQKATWWHDLAVARDLAEDAPGTISALQQAVVLDPADADSWGFLGVKLYLKHRSPEAVLALERCVALDPRNARAWFMLGYARADMDDVAGAIEALQKGLLLDPLERGAREALARLQEDGGDD